MTNQKLNGADYILILLYLDGKKPILGSVRLEKMMFLFKVEVSEQLEAKGLSSVKLHEFIAYNFGPFAKDIYEQIELFRSIEFIKVTNIKIKEEMGEVDDWEESPFVDELWNDDYNYSTPDNKYMKYEITEKGECFYRDKLEPLIKEEHKEILETFKRKIIATPIKQILRYVYTYYPIYTKNSIIKDKVLNSD